MPRTSRYTPRRPKETLLYRIVEDHLSEFLSHVAEAYSGPLPRSFLPRVPERSRGMGTSPDTDAEKQPATAASSEVGAMLLRPVVEIYPGCITLKHWKRVGNGALMATSRDIPWRVLLARTFGFDALQCPRCGKTMRVRGIVEDKDEARRILKELGVELHEARAIRTRDPTMVQANLHFDFGA